MTSAARDRPRRDTSNGQLGPCRNAPDHRLWNKRQQSEPGPQQHRRHAADGKP
jgi:hypothetical protein